MRRAPLCVPLLALAASLAAGQDAVEIKLTPLKPGDRVKVTVDDRVKSTTAVDVKGKTQTKEDEEIRTAVYVNEIITPGPDADSRPLKARRTYEKYAARKEGRDEPGPPLGKAILIEKKGDRYEFTLGGKPLDGPFAKVLAKEFNKPEGPKTSDLLPAKAVKPGESWKIDAARFVGGLAESDKIPLDPKKAAMTAKIVKTYKKNNKLHGIMEFTLDSPFKEVTEDGVTIKAGSTLAVKFTVDACIDGTDASADTRDVFSFALSVESNGVPFTLTSKGTTVKTEVVLPGK